MNSPQSRASCLLAYFAYSPTSPTRLLNHCHSFTFSTKNLTVRHKNLSGTNCAQPNRTIKPFLIVIFASLLDLRFRIYDFRT